jgi:hypothetical protein
MTGGMMAAVSGYDGFISYSHKHDAVLGPALQTNLERFAKPWYKIRALRIFLDTADLSANPALWPSIEDGLSSSQWFILLASADAAQSKWVNREAQWWIDHGSRDRVLVVGTSPGLDWDEQKRDWAADAPVPSALRGAFRDEPHWVDLSTVQLDSGKPKIPVNKVAAVAAPLRGKHLDELIGEHLRQHRRAMRLAEGAVAVMAVLTALAVTFSIIAIVASNNAIRERNDAIRQQTIALSRQVAADALEVDPTDPLTARQLALAAWRVFPTAQASSVLTTLLNEQQKSGTMYADLVAVNGVAFSPDGKRLASADDDGTVRLWDPVTGQAVGVPIRATSAPAGKFKGGVEEVAFSPNGQLLASASADGTTRLWNPVTGRPVGTTLPTFTDAGQGRATGGGLAFSPDSKLLARGDGDGTVGLWNPLTGRRVGALLYATSAAYIVYAVAFSPNGQLLASASADGTVRLWNPLTGRPVGAPIHATSVQGGLSGGVTFSPDGNLLATADHDGTVRMWNPLTGRPVGTPIHAPGSVSGIAFSPDGKLLATADDDGTVRL